MVMSLKEKIQEVIEEAWDQMWNPGFNITITRNGFTYRYRLRLIKHCDNGPAVEYPNGGTRCWFLNDRRHRTDGPAIEYPDGTGLYYIQGKEMTKKEYEKRDRSKDSFYSEG